MRLVLTYPPQINNYYIPRPRGRYISPQGKSFRDLVYWSVREQDGAQGLTGRLRVTLHFTLPDKRRRDLDNVLKPLFDALGAAGVYEDDSQIDELHVTREIGKRPGKTVIDIEIIEGAYL